MTAIAVVDDSLLESDYSLEATRKLAARYRETSTVAVLAHNAHRRAALAETTQAARDLRLARAEVAACMARRFKQWSDALEVALAEATECST